jgi:tRNA pseudouridine55 synthase
MANLTQLRMLENLDGFLLVDKPAGIAFSTVVKVVKRKFNLVKVGHGGSLDPAASGLLVLLVNDANKFVGDVMGADRAYEGAMRLGVATNTHDIYGEPVGKGGAGTASAVALSDRIASVLPEFKGDVFQTESRWCSVRREGSAGYEIADTGEHKPFMAHVYRFDIGEADGDRLPFSVVATKGLIVRTLVNDFGAALGCGAALESLRRVRVGKFKVEDAVPFDRVLETQIGGFADLVIPLSKALA